MALLGEDGDDDCKDGSQGVGRYGEELSGSGGVAEVGDDRWLDEILLDMLHRVRRVLFVTYQEEREGIQRQGHRVKAQCI